jgi:hypothetical protein
MRAIALLGFVAMFGGLGCSSVVAPATAGAKDVHAWDFAAEKQLTVGQATIVPGRARVSLPGVDARTERVGLENGDYIVFRTTSTLEGGRQALAQTFREGGLPESAVTVISPPDVDVVGSPQVVSTDGKRLVVTFAAATDRSVKLYSVAVERGSSAAGGERTAQF